MAAPDYRPPSPTTAAARTDADIELWSAELYWEHVGWLAKYSFDERLAALRRLLAAIATDNALHGDNAEYPFTGPYARRCPFLPTLHGRPKTPPEEMDKWELCKERFGIALREQLRQEDPSRLSSKERRAPMDFIRLEEEQRAQEQAAKEEQAVP